MRAKKEIKLKTGDKSDRHEYSAVIDRIKDFILKNQDEHDLNVTDFKISKNLAAGNGFTVVNRANIWKRDRARVSLNLLANIVNATCQTFTSDPFEINTDSIEREELTFKLGTVLREAATDGIAYLLAYKEEKSEKINFKRLNNFNVMYDRCEYADGKDCKAALYIDKKDSDEYWNKGELAVKLNSVLELKPKEMMTLTYWEKTEDGVDTYSIEGNELVDHVFQPLRRIPVVRFYGKEVFLETWLTWRGFYFQVKEIMMTMDYTLSLIQEKIATAPNHLYNIAAETLGDNLNQWNRLNDIPKAFLTFKSVYVYDGADGTKQVQMLPPPMPNNYDIGIEPLIASYNFHLNLLNQTIGNIAGESSQNETAEAVLLKKENKISATNELVKNLLDSAYEVRDLIEDFTGETNLKLTENIFAKIKKQEDLKNITAFLTMAQQNELVRYTAPVLIEKLDLTDEEKKQLTDGIAQSYQPTQEMQQKDQELQQAQQQIQALTAQLNESKAAIDAQLATAQIKEQGLYERKIMDMEFKFKELELKMAQMQIDSGKKEFDNAMKSADLNLDGQKAANDFAAKTQEIEQRAIEHADKTQLELMKIENDANASIVKNIGVSI